MKKNTTLAFACCLALVSSACSIAQYSYVQNDVKATPNDPSFVNQRTGEVDYKHEYQFSSALHEIILSDRSGFLCAGLFDEADKITSRAGAVERAKKSPDRTATYSYRKRSPAEYAGDDCGLYARWGDGQGTQTIPHSEFKKEFDQSYFEMGLNYMAMQDLLDDGILRFAGLLRFGFGRFTVEDELKRDGIRPSGMSIRMPVHFGFMSYPYFLYGLGAEVMGGADPFAMFLTRENGKWYSKFDYSARVGYVLPLEYFSLGAHVGYARNHHGRGDFWDIVDQWSGTITLDVNMEDIF